MKGKRGRGCPQQRGAWGFRWRGRGGGAVRWGHTEGGEAIEGKLGSGHRTHAIPWSNSKRCSLVPKPSLAYGLKHVAKGKNTAGNMAAHVFTKSAGRGCSETLKALPAVPADRTRTPLPTRPHPCPSTVRDLRPQEQRSRVNQMAGGIPEERV